MRERRSFLLFIGGETRLNHQMPIGVEKGAYELRCVDEDGVELYRKLVVM